jgi:hypothetical protein
MQDYANLQQLRRVNMGFVKNLIDIGAVAVHLAGKPRNSPLLFL